MTVHLRSVIDSRGDTVDLLWYCSRSCWLASFEPDAEGPPPALDTADLFGIEEGGAYPCGSESDSPDYCQTCRDPIGNPLTGEGFAYVRELLAGGSLSQERREALSRAYPYVESDSCPHCGGSGWVPCLESVHEYQYPADNPCARLDLLSALSDVCESATEREVLARLRERIRNGL